MSMYDPCRFKADVLYRKAWDAMDKYCQSKGMLPHIDFVSCPHTAFDCRCTPRNLLNRFLANGDRALLPKEDVREWLVAEAGIKRYEIENWEVLKKIKQYKLI